MSTICIVGRGNGHVTATLAALLSHLEIVVIAEQFTPSVFEIKPVYPKDYPAETFKFNERDYPTLKEGLRNPKIRRKNK